LLINFSFTTPAIILRQTIWILIIKEYSILALSFFHILQERAQLQVISMPIGLYSDFSKRSVPQVEGAVPFGRVVKAMHARGPRGGGVVVSAPFAAAACS